MSRPSAKARRELHDELREMERRLLNTGPNRPKFLDLSTPEERYRRYLERLAEFTNRHPTR